MARQHDELVAWLSGHARQLSYNGKDAVLKMQLHEACTAIRAHNVSVAPAVRGGGLVVFGANGSRRLTRRERLALWLLKGKTEIRP